MNVPVLLTLLIVVGLLGCSPPKPKVIVAMENPATGARAELHRENAFKVPANYNEQKHIEEWKAEQIKKGYSVEVAR